MEKSFVNPSLLVAILFLSCIFGVALGDMTSATLPLVLYVGGLAVALLSVFFIQKKILFALLALACLGFSMGTLRMIIAKDNIVGSGEYMSANTFEIRVTSDITEKSYGSSFFGTVYKASGKQAWVGASVRAKTVEPISYGDTIQIIGVAEEPEPFATNSGALFDYPGYLHARGANVVIEGSEVEVLSHGGSGFKKILYSIGHKFKSGMDRSIREPELAFAKGILLGDDSNISKELQNSFVRTGTIHVLALSGYNVTIVADFFKNIFSFLPKLFALGAGGVAIVLFVIMTGGAPSAVRAGIMASIALFGKGIGRTAHAGMILLFATGAMLLANPWQLLHDLGFQLSVVATWGILYIPEKIQYAFRRVPNPSWMPLREILVTSGAAWIAVSPLILFSMHTFSPIAPLANLLVLPLMPLAMFFSFASGLGTLLLAPLGQFSGFITEKILSTMTWFIEKLSHVSWSLLTIDWFGAVFLFAAYGLIMFWVYKKKEIKIL